MKLSDLFAAPRTNVVPSILEFPMLDIDGMIRRLRLRERASEQGKRNLPSSDSSGFDAVEQEIVNEIEVEGKTQLTRYLEHQKTYSDRAAHLGVGGLIFELTSIASDATTEFERMTRLGTGELFALKRDVIESDNELTAFKARNELNRLPRDQGSKALKWGVLVFILSIEALLNGYFLAKGSVFGYLGGVFDALLIAAMNVAIGYVAGRFVFPWLWHRNLALKTFGLFGVATYVAAAMAFNIGVAHYRNALGADLDPTDAPARAYEVLMNNPLAVHDLQSWLLFMLGVLFSGIAAYDALRMDDPYPGYGRRAEQNRRVQVDYLSLKEELLAELESRKQAAEQKMDDLARTISGRHRDLDHIVMSSQTLKAAMLTHFNHLESAANTLLREYRNENAAQRNTPTPGRFEIGWTFPRPALEQDVVTNTDREAFARAVSEALRNAPSQREALHAAYRKAITEYRRIDELIPESAS